LWGKGEGREIAKIRENAGISMGLFNGNEIVKIRPPRKQGQWGGAQFMEGPGRIKLGKKGGRKVKKAKLW